MGEAIVSNCSACPRKEATLKGIPYRGVADTTAIAAAKTMIVLTKYIMREGGGLQRFAGLR